MILSLAKTETAQNLPDAVFVGIAASQLKSMLCLAIAVQQLVLFGGVGGRGHSLFQLVQCCRLPL